MPYRLKTGETTQRGVRRVLSEQILRAIAELSDESLERAETIHQVRKRCKKIRATLRLVRSALGPVYSRENAWYRDAARSISQARDTEAMIGTCDSLSALCSDPDEDEFIGTIRSRLEAHRHALTANESRIDGLLQNVASRMEEGLQRVATLSIEGDGGEATVAGMRKTYARARRAMKAACNEPSTDTFHEWRKRAKYHWYHMRLLREAWPAVIQARRSEAGKLGKWLGSHHDLCVLRAWVASDPECSADGDRLALFTRLVDERIAQLEQACRPLGRRLFAEKPKQLARRFGVYVDVWSASWKGKA